MQKVKRICLFDVDGTLTKPRNVKNVLKQIENIIHNALMSEQVENDYGYWVCWRK
jgi:phosphoserine phosphatase